jgi:8-oxo-dGTP pyrophosphatase MutT (NUDIX family)
VNLSDPYPEVIVAVIPEDAATVILLREPPVETDEGFEVLMVLRHARSQFVPEAYVFPGGKLDATDCSSGWEEFCRGITPASARERLEGSLSPERALGSWVAGIRETFEEAGILLAVHRDGSLVHANMPADIERFGRHRRDLIENRRSFIDMIREERLLLAGDELHYFSHWITPEILPIRYDVRFFVARAPSHQSAVHDGVEVIEHVWRTPRAMLSDYSGRRFNMVLPTLVTIETLAGFQTIDEVIASTKNKKINGILTRLAEEDGQIVEYLPDGKVYRHLPPTIR